MVRIASAETRPPKPATCPATPVSAARKTRTSTAKEAVFTPAAMKAVTGVGAPS